MVFSWICKFLNCFYLFFSSSTKNFIDLGFGSVFNGADDFGEFANISTQAVMSMIKHVGDEASGINEHVVIDSDEVDRFCLPQAVLFGSSNADGRFLFC